ncbi:hypothetical protein ACLESO_05560 [Pyxidicoccus sp. 3LG]
MTRAKSPRTNAAPTPSRTEAEDPSSSASPFWDEQDQRIDDTRDAIRHIHRQLSAFLRSPGAEELAARAGGDHFLEAEISTALASRTEGFEFPYFGKKWAFTRPFLWTLCQARDRLREPVWEEFIRLFLLHEGYHIAQGLTSYNYRGIGRAGFVLEGIDYDADVFSIQGCLAWRRNQESGRVREQGEMATLTSILETVIGGLSAFDAFEGRFPLQELPERRLRRYLIWYLQLARAAAAPKGLPVEQLGLGERVIVEAPGVRLRMEERGGNPRSIALLSELHLASDLEIAIYARGRLFRSRESEARDVLEGIRDNNVEKVKRSFSAMFDQMRESGPWTTSSTVRTAGSAAADNSPANPPADASPVAPSGVTAHAKAKRDAVANSVGPIQMGDHAHLSLTGKQR